MIEIIILGTALAMLLIASAYDMKWKYIPDYVNYSFIIIAIILRIAYAIETNNWMTAIWSIPSTAILFIFGYSMYKTGMWGGGDTKLVTALGVLISWFQGETIPYFLDYLANLLLIGGFYGVPAIIIIGLMSKEKIKIKALDKAMMIIGVITCIILFNVMNLLMALLLSAAVMTGSMSRLFKEIEKKCFKKDARIPELMDGDWLLEEIKIGRKKITPKKEGLSKKEVKQLMKWYAQGKIKTVKIKDGIAYVPALLITLIATMMIGNIMLILSTYGLSNAETIINLLQ